MFWILLQVWFYLLSSVLVIMSKAQTCEKLDPELFSPCVNISHGQTFKMPSSVDKNLLSRIIHWSTSSRVNCTVPLDVSFTVQCALFVPQCKEGRKTPFPPCRRVCAEMIHGCSNSMSELEKDHFGPWCNVLPDLTAASGQCFEPKNFTPSINQSALPSLGKCHKRLFPVCGDQGYDHTILSDTSQTLYLKNLFNKTLNSTSLNSSDYSLPRYFEKDLQKYSPDCASILRKMYCIFLFPPCFPEKSGKYYGICKSECSKAAQKCPEIFRNHPEEWEMCSDYAEGEEYQGMCAHIGWPRTIPYLFRKTDQPVKPTKTKPGVIAAAVIVPVVVLAAVVVAVVLLVRRYNVQRVAYSKQLDDVDAIVET